jgi:hypothetical protein
MPEEYALLVRSCFDADPTKRPSFEQVGLSGFKDLHRGPLSCDVVAASSSGWAWAGLWSGGWCAPASTSKLIKHTPHWTNLSQQVVVCLELMLDNLSSEDLEAAADADMLSPGAHTTSASGSHTALSNTAAAAAAPAPAPVPANDQGLQQQQQQLLLRQPQQQRDARQAAAAAAAAVARLPATLSGGSQPPSTPVQASQPQLGPQVHILHSSGGVGASPIGSYPSTADAHEWQQLSSRQQLSSSSSSQHHLSSQLVAPAGPAAASAAPAAPAAAAAAAASLSGSGATGDPLFKAVSSLDDSVFLQDL